MNMPVYTLSLGILGSSEADPPHAPEGVVLGLVPAIQAACSGEDLRELVAIYLRFPSDESSGPIGKAIFEALFSFSGGDSLIDHVLGQRSLSSAEQDTLVAFAQPFAETVFRLRDRVLAANPAALEEAGAEGRDYFFRRVTAEIGITLFDEIEAAVRE